MVRVPCHRYLPLVAFLFFATELFKFELFTTIRLHDTLFFFGATTTVPISRLALVKQKYSVFFSVSFLDSLFLSCFVSFPIAESHFSFWRFVFSVSLSFLLLYRAVAET